MAALLWRDFGVAWQHYRNQKRRYPAGTNDTFDTSSRAT
jgi:hypothetical protein